LTSGGTRFRLYPQLAGGYTEPEVVELALPPGTVGPGPQDAAMYVANAVDKPLPYQAPQRLPPYAGPLHPPALPDPRGHFDRLPEGTPQFLAAHLYGSVRRVLDVWERYLGHRVAWWHAGVFPRLELVPRLRWGNAHAGFGFLETGLLWTRSGAPQPLGMNFDVVAHEVGHAILFSVLGAPARDRLTGAFLAFHECFADHVAAIAALHFRSVVARVLRQTRGNLYALNLVSRLGEASDVEQVRVLDNEVRLADLEGVQLGPDGGWTDPLGLGRRQHAAAAPMTGALWDCLVDLFQEGLVARGAIGPDLDARGWTRAEVEASLGPLERATGAALGRFAGDFTAALEAARDVMGLALARCVQRLSPDDLDFDTVAACFCRVLPELGQARMVPSFIENFLERGIDPRPVSGGAAVPGRPTWSARARAGDRVRGPPKPGRATLAGRAAHFGVACRRRCFDPFAVSAVGSLIEHPHREAAALAGG
jgi:hypothetical protein